MLRGGLEAGFEFAGIDEEENSLSGIEPATGIESLFHERKLDTAQSLLRTAPEV
jgi:hypothetical protein